MEWNGSLLSARRGRQSVLALILVTTLGACSNNGGQDAPATPAPASAAYDGPKASASATGAGIWIGKLSRGGQVVNSATCLVVESRELACALSAPSDRDGFATERMEGAVHGTLQVAGANQVSGSGRLYAALGKTLADGNTVAADFTITGGLLGDGPGLGCCDGANTVLELTISSLGDVSTLSATWDHYYDRGSSLSEVSRVYSTLNIYGDPWSFSIDPDGVLFSQGASGCVSSGLVNVLDPRFNGYAISMTVSNCPGLDGSYAGLATVTDFEWVNGTTNFLFAVFNDTATIAGEAVK